MLRPSLPGPPFLFGVRRFTLSFEGPPLFLHPQLKPHTRSPLQLRSKPCSVARHLFAQEISSPCGGCVGTDFSPSPSASRLESSTVPTKHSFRAELHCTHSTELRRSIRQKRHPFRTHSNPGELSLQRFERRRQPDLLFPERLARHRSGRFHLRSANPATSPQRRREYRRRLRANLWLWLRQRCNKNHRKNRQRKRHRTKSRERRRAPQPQVTTLTGAPLVQSSASGDHVFVTFGASPGGPVAVWNATAPNQFVISPANPSTTDLA